MTELPKVAHPTAKAFFDALDRHNQQQEGSPASDDNRNRMAAPAMSESLKRKSQSLGWRNRHSQNEFYPVQINASLATEKERTRQHDQTPCNFSVRQVQRGEVEGTYGTGATVWPAAVVLMKFLDYLISRPDLSDARPLLTECDLRGKHVLDLGAGTGVTSIAAALLGASSVMCTDGEDSVVRLAQDNIRRASHQLSATLTSERQIDVESTSSVDDWEDEGKSCGVKLDDDNKVAVMNACPLRTKRYWWGKNTSPDLIGVNKDSSHKGEDLTNKSNPNGLVILVADCVLPKLYPIAPLVQAIDECFRLHEDLLQENGSTSSACAILSYEHRYYPDYDPRTEFRRLATERSLDVFQVSRDEMDPIYSLEDVELWIVRRCSR